MNLSLFDQEVREKKREVSNQRSRTGSRGGSSSRKGVRTPSDYMTKKEISNLSSEVSVKNLFDLLLSKQEFEAYPEPKQKEILTRWREIYPNSKIMESLEIKAQGTFNSLLERLDVPKKRSWSRKGKAAPKKGDTMAKSAELLAADPVPDPELVKMDITILDGLDLKYNGCYNSDQLGKILTKLQLLIDGEENEFAVSISLQEKK